MTGRRAVYTHGHAEAVLRSHRWRTAENSAAYLVPHLRPGLSLLDVGCGPGTLTVDLAGRVAPGEVTAIEPTRDALDIARAEAAARSVPVRFAVADVQGLDLPDDTYDVVHAHQVLQHRRCVVRKYMPTPNRCSYHHVKHDTTSRVPTPLGVLNPPQHPHLHKHAVARPHVPISCGTRV